MRRSRKKQILIIFILICTIASLSVGFAAFSVSLNISSSATVSANSDLFSVKFSTSGDSVVVDAVKPSFLSDGVVATDAVIDNSASPVLSGLSATFTEPGQYVDYSLFVRNEGEYIAYLNNINYMGVRTCESEEMSSNVQNACDSINIKVIINGVEYSENTGINDHYLDKKTGENIVVRIDYSATGGWADAPFKVTLPNLMLVYSTVNDSSLIPEDMVFSGPTLYNVISEYTLSDVSIDFDEVSGDLINASYIRSGTEREEYPIYYYRGNVTENNVKFAGYCWKIVRTTSTGGIKIIYNGAPVDGSCNNTGEATHIALSSFNLNTSPAYVGYMYGDVYLASEKDMSTQSETYVYGNDVSWDGAYYTLNDTKTSSSWSSDYSKLTKYHYTCFNTTGVCEEVYYINSYESSSKVFYLTIRKGLNIEGVKSAMFTNTKSSLAKEIIDNWFSANMISSVDSLEDVVWCNDRNLVAGPLLSKDTSTTSRNYFESYNSIKGTPSLTCSSTRDSFTVSTANGNGKLTYPVGLLTASEFRMAGVADGAYLDNGQSQWSMSPYYFNDINADIASIKDSMTFNNERVEAVMGIRPVVSLKPGIQVYGGNGTADAPYLVVE